MSTCDADERAGADDVPERTRRATSPTAKIAGARRVRKLTNKAANVDPMSTGGIRSFFSRPEESPDATQKLPKEHRNLSVKGTASTSTRGETNTRTAGQIRGAQPTERDEEPPAKRRKAAGSAEVSRSEDAQEEDLPDLGDVDIEGWKAEWEDEEGEDGARESVGEIVSSETPFDYSIY